MRVRQWIQACILLFLGLYFLDNMLSGRIYFYINERFGWLSWVGTGLFLILGIMSIANLLRQGAPIDDHAGHDHTGHDHDHDAHDHDHPDHADPHEQEDAHAGHTHGTAPSWLKLAIVGFPLLIGLIVPAKPLGAAAVQNSGVSTGFTSIQGQSTQMNIAPTDRNVLDWVRAFNTSNDVKEFNGQKGDVIGFVYRDINFDAKKQLMVARFAISCCVADASAIGVMIQTDNAAKWAQDGWVHVRGTFQVQTVDNRPTPVLIADSIEQTTQPDHPYLYP